jgi:DNA processing protein
MALGMVPGIGNITLRKILAAAGSPEAVFRFKRNELLSLPGVGSMLADRILDRTIIDTARRELDYVRKNGIQCRVLGAEDYPFFLTHCYDAPYVLYIRGHLDLEGRKVLSVVGTRRPSFNGLQACKELIRELSVRYPDLVIISGLAYGIDHCAHKTALECGLDTVAVLAHGFKYLYPAVHRSLAAKIEAQGALVTDFPSGDRPEKDHFIKRNRIIAGLSQATVVVESGIRGGALITADLANSYDRDVFAFPGRVSDPASAGCNRLIKTHRADLIENYRDLEYRLGWESTENKKSEIQRSLFREPGPDDQKILKVLEEEGDCSIDMICFKSGLPVSRASVILLEMELSGMILTLPGDCYRKID